MMILRWFRGWVWVGLGRGGWISVRREYRDRFGSPTVSIGMFIPYLLHYALQKAVFQPPNHFSSLDFDASFLPGQ